MSVKVYDTITPASTTFPAVMAEHVNLIREDGTADSIQNLFNNKELGGGGDSSVTLTQEEFELLSDEEKFNGLYYTYDTKRIYKNGIQYGANEPLELTMDEFKALKEAGALDEKQEYIITTNENGTLLEASDIGYNGATSGLSSLSVQGAIDEVNDKIDNIIDDENVNENTVSTWSSKKITEELAKKENVYITNDASGSGVLYNAAEYLGVNSVDTYGIYNLVVITDTGESGECNFIYKHRVATYGNIISENGVTFDNLNEYGTVIVDSTSANRTFKVKYLGEPTEDMSGLSKYEYTRVNKNALVSDVDPTIDISKVFLNGTLNIATLCSTYGAGRYVAVGQGTTGNGTVTIDIWTLVGGVISYIVNALYSPKTSTMFVGYTYENPTIDFDANYFTHCNHIAKVCTLA